MIVRDLGLVDYLATWNAMRNFVTNRDNATEDEIWLVEHEPIYTQGQAGLDKHLLKTTDIPVIKTDRGGQITYHGPGQIILYTMIDIRKKQLSPKKLVAILENIAISTLADYDITSTTKDKAPGVYLKSGAKIAFIGLRFKKMYSYHGLSLNVKMNLKPFDNINPCGYENLKITDMANILMDININSIKTSLIKHANNILG